jgi:hypothetical protein
MKIRGVRAITTAVVSKSYPILETEHNNSSKLRILVYTIQTINHGFLMYLDVLQATVLKYNTSEMVQTKTKIQQLLYYLRQQKQLSVMVTQISETQEIHRTLLVD